MHAEDNYWAIQQTDARCIKKEIWIQRNPLIGANTQPGSKEIPEGAGNPAGKASTCRSLSSRPRQERRRRKRSWWPTSCLKQVLFLSKTPSGLREWVSLVPEINKKWLLASEKIMSNSLGKACLCHSLFFHHLHLLHKGCRYPVNAELHISLEFPSNRKRMFACFKNQVNTC